MEVFSKHITIFCVGLFFIVSCEFELVDPVRSVDDEADNPVVMIIKQQADSVSMATAGHLTQILSYTKIPSQIVDIGQVKNEFRIPESVRIICLTFSRVETFTDNQVEQILAFVSAGNTLLITNPVFEDRFNFLIGIKKDASDTFLAKAKGFEFNQPVFPKTEGRTFILANNFTHGGLDKDVFDKKVEIIAHSYDSLKVPVITQNRVGDGQTIMINSTWAHEKTYRGLLFSLMLPSLEGIAYPVANVSTIFLDDFPLPLYNVKKAPIDWEFDITEEQFVANVWWPDMQILADSFDIDYTAVMAFNYNANVVPPFDFEEWINSDIFIEGIQKRGSIGLAQQIKNSRHELGFHGYNHFPLWAKDWPTQAFMESALQAAQKRWQIDNLGPLPVTYVPPTNNIDAVGIEAILRAMPSVKYLSSLYLGNINEGGGREFGPDPLNPALYNFPRISSGFIIDEEIEFDYNSLYLFSGIWNHFVHPDDIFQIKERDKGIFSARNALGLGWHRSRDYNFGLYEVFKDFLASVQKTYPLIRYRTAKDAVPIVKDWNNLRLKRGLTDQLHYVSKQNQKNKLSFWFLYVDNSHIDPIKKYVKEHAEEYHLTPVRDGYLVQFRSGKDSLVFPDFRSIKNFREIPKQLHKQYLSFVTDEREDSVDVTKPWQDNRLINANTALRRNPSSHTLQEQVIKLAVEFDRVPFAIDVLEKRLLANEVWKSQDIERLLTYYGWSGKYDRSFQLLEKLWNRYPNEAVIKLKGKMVEKYGIPDSDFESKWLKRDLTRNSGNEQMLKKFISKGNFRETWPQVKAQLQIALQRNPGSDTLYFYTLQHSFYYDEPRETLILLNSFPDEAGDQLKPLALQIAHLYTDTANHSSKARWEKLAENVTEEQHLSVLLKEKRFNSFIKQADLLLARQPDNDSLRTFVGHELIYNKVYDEGYVQLYPLFESDKAQASTQKLVQTEIRYQAYQFRKEFYRKYPGFFSDSLEHDLKNKYRIREGLQSGLTSDYSFDNFNNTIKRIGVYSEWGNRQKYIQRVTSEANTVGSNDELSNRSSQLMRLNYQYQHLWPAKGIQFTAGAGFYHDKEQFRPDGILGFGYGVDSTYTSARLTIRPSFTNNAIPDNINEFNFSLYREDNWLNWLQTSFVFVGKRYSDEVYAGEGTGRIYIRLPFSSDISGAQFISELSYSDASEIHSGGIPYFTADQLFIKGFGAVYKYRDFYKNPPFAIQLELLGKHDTENGLYVTSSVRMKARLQHYWNVSLNVDISSSAVYRYNHTGLTVSHIFPRKF